MATMRDIVDGAAKRLGVIRAGEALDAEDSSDILQALNDMMGSWVAKSINISWTGPLALAGTFPLPLEHEAGVKAMLAVRVAEDFGKPITAKVNQDAGDAWHAINGAYRLPDPMRVERPLANMPSQRRTFI